MPSDLSQQIQEYETLLEIGVELSGDLDLGHVLETALERVELICKAEASSIWELDAETGELFFRVVRGAAASSIRGHRVALGEGIVGRVALSREAELVADVTHDARWQGDLVTGGFQTGSMLVVPLQASGEVVGVLQLLNPRGKPPFTPGDLERMRLFAGPLGVAVQNARLYSALEDRFHDTVTALAEAIEKRDPYTAGHIRRVVTYSVLLGHEMRLAEEDLERLRLAATLHDVGKIAVPDRVLGKEGPLNDEEVSVMRRHPVDGAEIIGHIGVLTGISGGGSFSPRTDRRHGVSGRPRCERDSTRSEDHCRG